MDMFANPPAAAAPNPNLVRLAALSKLLRRHLWLVLLCAALGGVAAYAYARTLPRSFTAASALTVEGDRFVIPELQGALRADSSPDPMPWVRTEVQALTARSMVSKVVQRLHLEQVPEFNAALRPKTWVQDVKDWIGPLLPGRSTKATDSEGEAGVNQGVVSAATKALDVFQDNRSVVISIYFTSEDPALAARFVNDLIETYVQTRAQRRVDANQGANQALTARIDQVREDVAAIERQMRDLRNKSEVVGIRAGSVSAQQLEELTSAAAKATLERTQLEINYERAQAAVKQGSTDALTTVLSSPTISRLRDQETAASSKMAELSSRYGPGYPGIRSAGAELGSVRRQLSQEATRIVDSMGAELRAARAQETDVKKQLEVARAAGVKSENTRAQLEQLQQEATSRRNLYQTLLERAQQTVVQPIGAETPDVRVLSPAIPPSVPSGPNMKVAGLMGGAGGALLGCLLALTRLRSVEGFETAAEFTRATGFPVAATVGSTLVRRNKGVLARGAAASGPDAEAMRLLRSRLQFAGRSGTPRAIAFLPVVASERAVTMAAAFARVAASHGDRVLLIEAELDQPRLAGVLGHAGGPTSSLHQALSGGDWRLAVLQDRQPGLDTLLASGRDPDPAALVQSPQFQNLLVEVREEYDVTVLDAGPADTADALAVVQRVDLAVLIVDRLAGYKAVQSAAARLASAPRTPVVAVMLSR